MRKSSRKFMLAAIVAAGFSGTCLPAWAEVLQFKAALKGGEQIPPVTTKGTGTVNATFDTVSKKFEWNVTYSDLTGPVTAAHFHGPANIGQTAPPEITVQVEKSPSTGSALLTESQAKDLLDGQLYFNVHTAAHKGGEIRGQVLKGL